MQNYYDQNTLVCGLGSNIEPRRQYLQKAYVLLKETYLPLNCSGIYETEPIGLVKQENFLNCIVIFKSTDKPYIVLKNIQSVEAKLGRDRTNENHWGPRTIDIDIIFYGFYRLKDRELTIPHDQYKKRRFVIEPLLDIWPKFCDPFTGNSIDMYQYDVCQQQIRKIKGSVDV